MMNSTEQQLTLSQQTVNGGFWLTISHLSQQFISLVQVTILGRILGPEVYGLIGIAYLTLQAIGVFISFGFDYALIQKPTLSEEDIHTTFWVLLGRNILFCALILLFAYPIALFYEEPDVFFVLFAVAFLQIIEGLKSPSLILFRREMQFQKLFVISAISSILGTVVGLVATLMLRNVWALVILSLATTVSLLLLSYVYHSYRPKFVYNRKTAKELSNYGRWTLGSSILSFVSSQGSGAFIGWIFDTVALGIYQMAGRFAMMPSIQIGDAMMAALMPAYSKIQNDRQRVSSVFLQTVSLTAIAIFAITTLVALGIPRLFVLLLGQSWIPAATLIGPIAIATGVRTMLRVGSPLFLGTGHPQYHFLISLVQTLTMVVMLYPLSLWYGINGAPYALMIGSLCSLPMLWIAIKRITDCSLPDVFIRIIPAASGVIGMVIVFYLGQIPSFAQENSIMGIIWFLFLIGIASICFLGIICIFQRTIRKYRPLIELRTMVFGQIQYFLIKTKLNYKTEV